MLASVSSSEFSRSLVGRFVKSYGCVETASNCSGSRPHFLFAPLVRFNFLFTHTILRTNSSGGVEMFGWKCGANSPMTTSALGSAALAAS
jgi:hypothetical protein